jgi:hypothetical protein
MMFESQREVPVQGHNWGFGALHLFMSSFWVVAVTDRAIVVCKAGVFSPAKPKAVTERLARQTRIGPWSSPAPRSYRSGILCWSCRVIEERTAGSKALAHGLHIHVGQHRSRAACELLGVGAWLHTPWRGSRSRNRSGLR